jgi:heptaprenyl diphosphate synthase
MAIIQEILDNVRKKIVEKTTHSYLFQHIPSPVLDENKLLLTVSLLMETEMEDNKILTYATSIMLIQIALDTHELVTNENIQKGMEKNRQLTVLAGDLYSGQYYKILAEIEDLNMLKSLSEGIKEVNENKIVYYQNSENNKQKMIDAVHNIESSLLLKLIHHYQLETWKPFTLSFLFVNRILQEKKTYDSNGSSSFVQALTKYEGQANQPPLKKTLLGSYIQVACDQLQEAMDKLPTINHFLFDSVNQMLQECRQQQMHGEEGY